MITLHYYPSNASMAPHILLHELGVPFRTELVDRTRDAHKRPDYLKLNPNGLIPVLVDGDLVLYEAAAICLHLVDSHPGAGLAPAVGTRARAHFYKWLVWLTNTLQATLIHYFYPERQVAEGDAEGAAQVKLRAMRRVHGLLEQVEAQLGAHGGPWLLGEAYTAVDPFLWMLTRWTRNFSERPARSFALIAAFQARMLERPAVQKAIAAEGLLAPHA